MLLPGLSGAVTGDARGTARVRLALAAVAVARYRLANGQLPDRLEDLAPKYLESVPVDPFDGKPIRYKKTE